MKNPLSISPVHSKPSSNASLVVASSKVTVIFSFQTQAPHSAVSNSWIRERTVALHTNSRNFTKVCIITRVAVIPVSYHLYGAVSLVERDKYIRGNRTVVERDALSMWTV